MHFAPGVFEAFQCFSRSPFENNTVGFDSAADRMEIARFIFAIFTSVSFDP